MDKKGLHVVIDILVLRTSLASLDKTIGIIRLVLLDQLLRQSFLDTTYRKQVSCIGFCV